jgi:hypothetical protein
VDENRAEPTVHERDGYRWINRCPVCNAEAVFAFDELDYWTCENDHWFDMPNEELLSQP